MSEKLNKKLVSTFRTFMFLKKEVFSKTHSSFFKKEKTYVFFIRRIKKQQLLYSHWVKRKNRKL
jgi:hypothetical protein